MKINQHHSDCGCLHYDWGIELCWEHQKKYEEIWKC
jgi:hypothetical protein